MHIRHYHHLTAGQYPQGQTAHTSLPLLTAGQYLNFSLQKLFCGQKKKKKSTYVITPVSDQNITIRHYPSLWSKQNARHYPRLRQVSTSVFPSEANSLVKKAHASLLQASAGQYFNGSGRGVHSPMKRVPCLLNYSTRKWLCGLLVTCSVGHLILDILQAAGRLVSPVISRLFPALFHLQSSEPYILLLS